MSNTNEKHRSMGEDLSNATLITILATGAGYASKKVFGDSLDTPTTFKGVVRFWTAISLGTISLNLLRRYELLPIDIDFRVTKN